MVCRRLRFVFDTAPNNFLNPFMRMENGGYREMSRHASDLTKSQIIRYIAQFWDGRFLLSRVGLFRSSCLRGERVAFDLIAGS
jgi:hypothetical protein